MSNLLLTFEEEGLLAFEITGVNTFDCIRMLRDNTNIIFYHITSKLFSVYKHKFKTLVGDDNIKSLL